MATILITGGSGGIGKRLIPMLQAAGHQVRSIGRSIPRASKLPSFIWNLETMTMDEAALDGVSHIIHLAGAGIADSRWTIARKEEIITSRVIPIKLLADTLKARNQHIEAFISASGIGYYGAVTSAHIYTEDDAPAEDFLGKTCQLWEDAVQLFDGIAHREVRIRTGVVLDEQSGALPKLMLPAKFGIAASLGNGKQWMPWVHYEDLCRIYVKAIEDNDFCGAYNAVSPQHTTHKQVLSELSAALHKPFWLPSVPSFAMKTAMGEMADMLLDGSRVSSQRLVQSGFIFRHPDLKQAFTQILN
jgi:uncharacterized protein (TIGR01777 family)